MKEKIAALKMKLPERYGLYLFLLCALYLLSTEELMTNYHIGINTLFRNLLPIPALILLILSFQKDSEEDHAGFRSTVLSLITLCGIVFAFSGVVGWCLHHHQTLLTTLQAMYEHLRFFLSLYLFAQLFRRLPMRTYAFRLFIHTAVLSSIIIVLSFLDFRLYIWPRQIYRFGIGSIQLFFWHPSNLGAHAVFFIAMLCLLRPHLGKSSEKFSVPRTVDTILSFLMLVVVLMTLRIRLFGFAAVFVILYFYMIVLRKKLHLPIILAGAAATLLIGWKRLYDFYFSPYAYTMARGQFALNSLDIALKNMPFGTGFGTFGSRRAQLHYSPVYYEYYMMLIPGLSPEHSNYACDTFFPVILAESGWLGFAAYAGMLILITALIFHYQKTSRTTPVLLHAVFTACMLLVYELAEATGTLAFSEIYSILIALALGFAFSQMHDN